jgi:hypothetical protein
MLGYDMPKAGKSSLYLTFIALILLFNKWIINTFIESPIIVITSILLFVSYLLNFHQTRKFFVLIAIIIFILLSYLQLKVSSIQNLYQLSPSDKDLYIKRMSYYPVKITRLAYWLEYKKETLVIYKFQENFFNVIDINQYFPNYFSMLLLPFTFYGIYRFINLKNWFLFTFLFFTVLLLTLTGVNGRYGPVLIFPYVNLFSYIGISKIFKVGT